jgi:hypothetical protein
LRQIPHPIHDPRFRPIAFLDIRFLLDENQHAITDERFRELCERFAGPNAYNLVRMTS